MDDELCIPITSEADIVLACQQGRDLAARLGASSSELTLIATAISEVARNIVAYAQHGEIRLGLVEGNRRGIQVVARDQGTGIPDIDQAMRDGYSTGGGLGLGMNAIDACPTGGKVTVRTRAVAGGVEVHVIDTGCGIRPEIRDRIFDPFFTTKPPGKGTGLGLSISHAIVEEHGGRIEVDSAPGQGAHFLVRLPLEPPGEAAGPA